MTALAAEDAHFTSAPTSPDRPLNTTNNPSKPIPTQLYSETSFCDLRSAGTTTSVANHVDHPTDDDDDHHHDRRHPVDLCALRNEILQTGAQFSSFLDTFVASKRSPTHPRNALPQPTSTATTTTTDDADDSHRASIRQPVDLLELQREVKEFMARMDSFFDSLRLSITQAVREHDAPNDTTNPIARTVNPSTTATDWPNQPRTIGEYLTLLDTPVCFVPHRLFRLPAPQTQSTNHLLSRRLASTTLTCGHYQHQFLTTVPIDSMFICPTNNAKPNHLSQNLPHLAPLLHHTANPWFLIDHVLPGQLDRPPDQIYPTCMPLTPQTHQHGPYGHPLNKTQSMDWQHLAVHHPVAHFVEKHDLRPP